MNCCRLQSFFAITWISSLVAVTASCVSTSPTTPKEVQDTQVENEVETMFDSATPGTSIRAGDKIIELSRGTIAEGQKFPSVALLAADGSKVDISGPGEVRIISVVPSIKTKVCDIQSHRLDETLSLHPRVKRVTISLDTPAEQGQFAKDAKLTHISFYSDTLTGDFGRRSGLLMTEKRLLARAVIVLDRNGIVQYLQLVPDVTKLPDLDGAIAMANGLVEAPQKGKVTVDIPECSD